MQTLTAKMQGQFYSASLQDECTVMMPGSLELTSSHWWEFRSWQQGRTTWTIKICNANTSVYMETYNYAILSACVNLVLLVKTSIYQCKKMTIQNQQSFIAFCSTMFPILLKVLCWWWKSLHIGDCMRKHQEFTVCAEVHMFFHLSTHIMLLWWCMVCTLIGINST